MKKDVIGLIPARMESTRFPGKPIYNINGKPMIWWVYNQAKKCKNIDEIFVVTPNEDIRATCEQYDLPCMFNKRQGKTAAEKLSLEIDNIEADIILNIQGDEPLLNPDSLNQIINELQNNQQEYYVGLVSLIEDETEFNDYNVVKTVLNKDGYAMYFSRSPIPNKFEYGYALRVLGLYGYRKWFLEKYKNHSQTKIEMLEGNIEMIRMLEQGYKIKFLHTIYNTIGVDKKEQVESVEKILRKKK